MDKTIEKYNADTGKVDKLRREYDLIVRKNKTDGKELELRKRKELEDLEVWKEDELEKMKKEKKNVEIKVKTNQ